MLKKLTEEQLSELLKQFCDSILALPQLKVRQIILYGSYARGDADDESDVDIMILTDIPREKIPEVRQQLAKIASDLGWKYDPVVSPMIQNYDFFMNWVDGLPFYRNVLHEGVKLYAA